MYMYIVLQMSVGLLLEHTKYVYQVSILQTLNTVNTENRLTL